MAKETVVLYPSPGKGHLVSMVELGKTLLDHHHPPPFSVTVILSVPPEEAEFTAAYVSSVSISHPAVSFQHLPVSFIPFDSSSPSNFIISTYEFTRGNSLALHASLSKSGDSTIRALVLDFFCTAACQVGASLNIPVYYYYTSGASGLAPFLYIPTMHKNIPGSFKDLDPEELIEIPGTPPIQARDMPMPIRDRSSKLYGYFLGAARDMALAAGIIINTFDSFEVSAIKALRDGLCVTDGHTPPLYCVGPLVATARNNNDEDRHDCLRWLDSQPSRSVLFLSFGSLGKFSTKQLKEIALGLQRSRIRFLWVVRVPPQNDEAWRAISEPNPGIGLFLPDGFVERTKERGFVVESWVPQVAVLNHSSVGGFVTHCGWNSVLEAVCAGVPMLAWPLYAEQKLNCNYLVEEVRVALPVKECEDSFVSADELEERVTELMSSEKGEAVRERVFAMKEEAAEALREGGSSHSALAELFLAIKQGPGVEPRPSDPVEPSGRFGSSNSVAIPSET
ncbi:UDP-glycosyltransferase 88B1-like [Punica granatum]|uniref:Glycosyltransferase n=1 Tax=Punica granatum TaxID=22663 RepID=A0A6P8D2R7_PUNGR|nr:UDP-glycosyltransferase 88B1-like [Punica granatum]